MNESKISEGKCPICGRVWSYCACAAPWPTRWDKEKKVDNECQVGSRPADVAGNTLAGGGVAPDPEEGGGVL